MTPEFSFFVIFVQTSSHYQKKIEFVYLIKKVRTLKFHCTCPSSTNNNTNIPPVGSRDDLHLVHNCPSLGDGLDRRQPHSFPPKDKYHHEN